MADVAGVLARQVSTDQVVNALVEGARSDVVAVLGAVVARRRARLLGDDVRGRVDVLGDQVETWSKERDKLAVEVDALVDRLPGLRADLQVARQKANRARVSGGDVPDVQAVETRVREVQAELGRVRPALTTVTNRATKAKNDRRLLVDLLARLEAVDVAVDDVLPVLGGAFTGAS